MKFIFFFLTAAASYALTMAYEIHPLILKALMLFCATVTTVYAKNILKNHRTPAECNRDCIFTGPYNKRHTPLYF
jgi:hypothetical protein